MQATAMLAKHQEFETAASVLQKKGASRHVETTPGGITQHVVELNTSLLRWPTHYAGTALPKVRYESISAHYECPPEIDDGLDDSVEFELRMRAALSL